MLARLQCAVLPAATDRTGPLLYTFFKVVLDSKSDTTTTAKITTQRHYISHYAYDYPLLAHYCNYYHGKSENRPIKKRQQLQFHHVLF